MTEKPKFRVNFSEWQLGGELQLFESVLLGLAARLVGDILTDPETFAWISRDGVKVESDFFENDTGIRATTTIPWGGDAGLDIYPALVEGEGQYPEEGNIDAIRNFFEFLRKRLDFWEVTDEQRAELRAIFD